MYPLPHPTSAHALALRTAALRAMRTRPLWSGLAGTGSTATTAAGSTTSLASSHAWGGVLEAIQRLLRKRVFSWAHGAELRQCTRGATTALPHPFKPALSNTVLTFTESTC